MSDLFTLWDLLQAYTLELEAEVAKLKKVIIDLEEKQVFSDKVNNLCCSNST